MPVITGSRGGGSTGPYLTLQWDVIQTDIANNRSKVRLILKLNATYTVRFSASKSGKLQGSSFTYTSGASGTGSWTLRTTEVWVSHNSDGTKTQNFSGSFGINITYSGSWVGTLSVSGNATLPVIPRQSLLNSASITNLKNGSSSTLSIGRTVYHNGFYHLVSIYDGNTLIWDSGYVSGAPATSYTMSSTTVNKMLNRMPTATSKTFTVRLRTYTSSGGKGLIGTQSRNMSVGVDSSVKPTASGLLISQEGNSVSSHYLQTISRVKAEFSASAGYGASISTRRIIVRKVGGSNAQTISGASGTTTNPIASTGSYEVIATARDSRGRTSAELRKTFTATAYTQPSISEFTVTRQENAQTVVDISRAGNWTSLGGKNVLDISVERKQGTGNWSEVETTTGTATSGSFSRDFTNPSNSVSLSYDYRLVISDKFGNSAESIASISTQRVVLDIHKNEGVGIGKIRERGVLDVDGEVYLSGGIYLTGIPTGGPSGNDYQLVIDPTTGNSAIEIGSTTSAGSSFIDFHTTGSKTDYDARIIAENGVSGSLGEADLTITADRLMYRKRSGTTFTVDEIIAKGSNERGVWVRYYDGTQICIDNYRSAVTTNNAVGSIYRSSTDYDWVFPAEFANTPSVNLGIRRTGGGPAWGVQNGGVDYQRVTGVRIAGMNASTSAGYLLSAIGRWK